MSMSAEEIEICKKTMETKNKQYLEFHKDRKYDEIAELYSPDCRFMPSGFPIQKGRDGIAGFWKTTVELGFHKLSFETLEVMGPIGDHVAERCKYVFHDEKGNEIQVGKYIMIWRKEAGEWKYLWELWNPDTLPPKADKK